MRAMLRLTGDTEFSFETTNAAYQKYAGTRGSRWPEQERIGRAPALQHVGIAAADTTLDGVIYPGVLGGLQEDIRNLRLLSLSQKPYQMVTGTGQVCGFWAVVEVSDTRSVFTDDGRARKIEFSLKLKYYGSDYQGGGASPLASSGIAQVSGVLPDVASVSGLDMLPVLDSNSTLGEMAAVASAAGAVVRNVASLARDVLYYVENPLAVAGLAANLILPVECMGSLRAVAETAQTILAVGDQVLDTISAVTALPYTIAEAGSQRMTDIAQTLRQNLVHTRDTARLASYGMDAVQHNLESTGNTFARLTERQTAADMYLRTADQAGRMGRTCRQLDQECVSILEKFR
ncbi:hypothetical protein FACS1894168_2660 [Deltaproteobacteria bacterium]|nr:hypothetical protein FACS1894168_2660 [Deltaproteobacteria bacterium]